MTSISASERARQEDKVRKAREDYEAKEAEGKKSRNAETARLNERYRKELNAAEESFNQRLDNYRDRSENLMNERDLRNNEKIEEMRQAYQESLRSKLNQKDFEKENLKAAYQSDLEKQRAITANQRDHLLDQIARGEDGRAEEISSTLNELQQTSQNDLKANSRRFNERNLKEKTTLIEGYDEILANEQRKRINSQRALEAKLRAEEREHKNDVDLLKRKISATSGQAREEYKENLGQAQNVLKQDRQALLSKYERALEKNTVENEEVQDRFRDQINNRLDGQVRSREYQIKDLKDRLAKEISARQKQGGTIRSDIIAEYESRIRSLESANKAAIERNKEIGQIRVDKAVEESRDIVRQIERRFKDEKFLEKTKHQQDRANTIAFKDGKFEELEGKSKQRIGIITNQALDKEKKMNVFFKEAISEMKDNFGERLDKQRESSINNYYQTVRELEARFKKMEISLQSKIDATELKYQDKITQLMEDQANDIRRLEKGFTEKMTNKDKAFKMDKESLKQKYEARLAQMKVMNEEDRMRNQERHLQEIQAVTAKVNSLSKKV